MPKNRNKFKKKSVQVEQLKMHVEMPNGSAAAANGKQAKNGSKNVRKKNQKKKTKNHPSANGPVDSKDQKTNKAHSGELNQQQENVAHQVSAKEQPQFTNKNKKAKANKNNKTKKPMVNSKQTNRNEAEINPKSYKRAAPAPEPLGAKKPKIKLENAWNESPLSDNDLHKFYDYDKSSDSNTDISVSSNSNTDFSMSSTDDTYSISDEFESDFDYEFDSSSLAYDDDDRDGDYMLPKHVPEDVRIHKGTAEKRALRTEDNVEFDSDNDEPQIIELPDQQRVISVMQPKGYQREVICKLHEAYYARTSFLIYSDSEGESYESSEYSSDSTECPDLVPIAEDDEDNLAMVAHVHTVEKDNSHVPLFSACGRKTQGEKVNEDVNWQNVKQPYKAGAECEILTCPAFDKADDEVEPVALPQQPSETSSDEGNESEKISYSPVSKESKSDIDSRDASAFLEVEAHNDIEIGDSIMPSSSPKTPKQRQEQTYIYCGSVNKPWVLVLLKEPLYFYGTVRCQLLQGAVEIYGYQPDHNEEVEIFSPRGCSSVQVSPIRDSSDTADDLKKKFNELKQQFSSRQLEKMLSAYEPGADAVIMLKRNASRRAMLQTFKQNMSENVFPHIQTVRRETHPNYSHECLIDCVLNTEGDRSPLHIPVQWQQIEMHKQSKVLVAGGKAVGKSTLLRYLVNCHLKQFAQMLVIDLDIGQSELFMPETISCFVVSTPLLGPGFFYNQQPAKAIAVGSVNVVLCKEKYLQAIEELVSFCYSQEGYRDIPWLLNTMGYNKGFGMELIAIITKLCRPSTIIQLQSNKDINNFDAVLEPNVLSDVLQNMVFNQPMAPLDFSYHLLKLDSPVLQESRYKKKWEMGPKDMRYAMILSRLSDAMTDEWTPLKDCVPLCIPLQELKFVNLLNRQESKTSALQAVNIGLVYLCHWLSDETPLECIGTGFLRSVDLPSKQVYIIPAMPYERIHAVNCVAFGEMELPTSFILAQHTWEETSSTYVYTSQNADSSKAVKQMFYRSPQFLTGKHKSVLE